MNDYNGYPIQNIVNATFYIVTFLLNAPNLVWILHWECIILAISHIFSNRMWLVAAILDLEKENNQNVIFPLPILQFLTYRIICP